MKLYKYQHHPLAVYLMRSDPLNPRIIEDFAHSIGASVVTVKFWLYCKNIPNEKFMKKIIKKTKGQVTPNDFYYRELARYNNYPFKSDPIRFKRNLGKIE